MPKTPSSPERPNRLTITDFNKSFLQPIVQALSVGDTCTLTVTGKITGLEETNTGGGGYMCELDMEPTAASHKSGGGDSSRGTMVGDMKRAQQLKAGQSPDDIPPDDSSSGDY